MSAVSTLIENAVEWRVYLKKSIYSKMRLVNIRIRLRYAINHQKDLHKYTENFKESCWLLWCDTWVKINQYTAVCLFLYRRQNETQVRHICPNRPIWIKRDLQRDLWTAVVWRTVLVSLNVYGSHLLVSFNAYRLFLTHSLSQITHYAILQESIGLFCSSLLWFI